MQLHLRTSVAASYQNRIVPAFALLNEAKQRKVFTPWILHCVHNDPVAFVMLSEAKHPCTGFLTAFGMTEKCNRNNTKKCSERYF